MVEKESKVGMRFRLIVWAAAMGLLVGSAATAEATSYTFTKIADTKGQFSSFGFASINDEGKVAFSAAYPGGRGIYRSDGATTTTIADTKDRFRMFFGPLSINDQDTVAFKASLYVGGFGIYTSDGETTRTIADATASTSSRFVFVGYPSVNDKGKVAFLASNAGGLGIFTSDGTSTETVSDTSGLFSGFPGDPSINDGDTVAFLASNARGVGIYTNEWSTPTTIADLSGPFNGLGHPAINNEGILTFWASLDAGGAGIFVGNGTAPTVIADTAGAFYSFVGPSSINNEGTVAFWAKVDQQVSGIYTGPDPIADKVIAVGDLLSDYPVTGLVFSREGLNNAGQLAFVVRLGDGTQAVYRADPAASEMSISLDIKPGGNPNTINLKSKGTLPVAILSTDTFDAMSVDLETVTLAGAPVKLKKNGTHMAAQEDVDEDGRLDLVFHVATQDLDLDEYDTEAVLEGKTREGMAVIGADSVQIVP